MPKLGKNGRYILSAGEISVYSLCPESWRLRVLANLKSNPDKSAQRGQKLHSEWANTFDNAASLARSAKLLVLLILLTVLLYALLKRL